MKMQLYIMSIAIVVVVSSVLADAIKSSSSAKSIARIAQSEIQNSYAIDGLLSMWDGQWNNGLGSHAKSLDEWKNLVDGMPNIPFLSPRRNGSIVQIDYAFDNDNFVHMNDLVDGLTAYTQAVMVFPSNYTLEVALAGISLTGSNGDKPLFMVFDGSSGNYRTGFSIKYGYVYVRSYGTEHKTSMPFSDGMSATFAMTVLDKTLTVYCNGQTILQKTNVPYGTAFIGNVTTCYRPKYTGFGCTADYYRMSIYNRALNEDEIAHNYAIDKERFGL